MPRPWAWSGLLGAGQYIRRRRRRDRPHPAGKGPRSAPRSGTQCVVDRRLKSEFDSGSRRVTGRAESLLKDLFVEYIIKSGRQNHLFVLADAPGVACTRSGSGVAGKIEKYFREEDRVKQREEMLADRIQVKVQIDPAPEFLVRFKGKGV